jgi:hypothetical protein
MPFPVQCQCGQRFLAQEWLAGKTVACPACGFALQVVPPRSAPETAAPAHLAPARDLRPAGPVAGRRPVQPASHPPQVPAWRPADQGEPAFSTGLKVAIGIAIAAVALLFAAIFLSSLFSRGDRNAARETAVSEGSGGPAAGRLDSPPPTTREPAGDGGPKATPNGASAAEAPGTSFLAGPATPPRARRPYGPVAGRSTRANMPAGSERPDRGQGASSNHLPQPTVSFRHPRFGNLYFALEDVRIHELPSTESLATRRLNQAVSANDAGQVMEAARWALCHGLLPQFYEGVEKALAISPQHPEALHVTALKRQLDSPLEPSPALEAELRNWVSRPDMKLKTSKHFLLLHDTPDKPAANRKLPRADERLELLETVYESFLLRFSAQGIELEIPRERLKVVLFSEYRDFAAFSQRFGSDLGSAAGFWTLASNVSVFFDQGTHESFAPLKELTAKMQEAKKAALENVTERTKDTVRLADTFALLLEIAQESSDVEVVSHEATHQLAGNTGLMPRSVLVPTWVAEGLATYFESPRDAAWSGIGAVNKQRLRSYRELQSDREHSDIDFITSDEIFSHARADEALLYGYGQSWALTHFLMEKRFPQLMKYYRRLGEMPADVVLSPEVLTRTFNEAFGEERSRLDSDWRTYMRSLKTDLERLMEER